MKARLSTASSGLWAEARALHLLQTRGWGLLHQRWCCRYGEIDLLMSKNSGTTSRLLAVEVKGRRRCGPDGWGQAALNTQKRRRLARTLNCWFASNPEYATSQLQVVLALVPLPPSHRAVRWLSVTDLSAKG
jgi:putative endonuclease